MYVIETSYESVKSKHYKSTYSVQVLFQEIKSLKIDGLDLPYYPVEMDGGSECDLTGEPRKSHVMYICQPNGRGEIYQLKETSSCEYDIIVLTSVLCSHPAFK